MEIGGRRLPEAIFVEILTRFPLRTITRFKTVSKKWKSVIESSDFRVAFVSRHRRSLSSSSWSLMFVTEYAHPVTEAISFHGCETHGLPKSLVSHIPAFEPKRVYYLASSNGLVWINVYDETACSYKHFVGNPVLKQWVKIPKTPEPCHATGLVTKVEKNGKVSSFKVVKTCKMVKDSEACEWRVCVYSSETGVWSVKRLFSASSFCHGGFYPPLNVNGKLYMWGRGLEDTDPGVLVVYDFYGSEDDDQCRVIPLPVPYNSKVSRCLTTSQGDVFYIEVLVRKLKVWRLNENTKSGECWQLLGEEINIMSVGSDVECTPVAMSPFEALYNRVDLDCIPMAMNPFDSDIVYLWSREHKRLVLVNLQTQDFIVDQEPENWSNADGCYCINTTDCKRYVKEDRYKTSVIMLSQYVLPQWMDSVPNPSLA